MKYTEFVKLMEDRGFEVSEEESSISVYRGSCYILAFVNKTFFAEIGTSFGAFNELNRTDQEFLLRACTELALTPLEEREDEEKYYYELKGLGYLNYNTTYNSYFIGNKENCNTFKTHFTDAEFNQLPKDIKEHNWEKVKVERED